jgi:glycosyltransferase involved in cell wall biosynthesis
MNDRAPRLGYLIPTFPLHSSTFIVEEIEAMRSLGADIQIFSVHIPISTQRPRCFDAYAEETKSVFPIQWHFLIYEHLRALFCRPAKYAKSLRGALTLGRGLSIKDRLRTVIHWIEAPLLFRLFRKASVEHVHVHFLTGASSAMLFVNQVYGLPFTLTAHGSDIFVEKVLQKEKICAAKFTRVMTEYNQKALTRIFPPNSRESGKLVLIPLGLHIREVTKNPPMPQDFTFLHVGRMVWQKGQHLLLEACQMLVEAGYKFRLIFVGDGGLKQEITELVKQRGLCDIVELRGALPKDDILDLYRSTNCFVLSSISEGSPAVLIEAMLEGQPIIAPRLHGIPEMFSDDREGWLFEAGNVSDLARKMEKALKKADALKNMGMAARQNAIKKFDLVKNTRKFYSHLSKMLH